MNLIRDIERAGMTVRLNPNGKLFLSPADLLTDELRQRIVDNRPAVVAALQASTRALNAASDNVEELTRLVRLAGVRYQFTEAEHDEALQVALADPVSALTCFRAIAREIHPVISTKTCTTIPERKAA